MKLAPKAAVFLALALALAPACTAQKTAKIITQDVKNEVVCILTHAPAPPAQVAIDCGQQEVAIVVDVLAAKAAPPADPTLPGAPQVAK